MSKVKLNKKVLSYKDYIVFETLLGDYEVHDYTYKTPTTWLCWIFKKSEYTLEKAKTKIDECIINNRIAREESVK
tara:strand:+ start:328 stop:552 length:225 start_codon:yes stop_codon:yes gene_type:complete